MRTFERHVLGNVERSVLLAERILSIAPSTRHHLVETGYSVSLLKLINIGSDAVHDAGDVVACVHGLVEPFWNFPGPMGECMVPSDVESEHIYQSLGFEPETTTWMST